jgi:xanthine dehydrogenase accessory factor
MSIYAQMADLASSGKPFCSALILSAEGSTPREAGVRAIVEESGRIHGTVGGGIAEAQAQEAAVAACRSGQATIVEVLLEGASAGDHEPVCGGRMRILLDPTAAKDRAAYAQAAQALASRERGVLITAVYADAKTHTAVRWVPEADVPALPHAEVCRRCLTDGEARLAAGWGPGATEEVEVLVEPVVPNPLLLIAGGGHLGQALARQAVLIGFDVTVIDDRPEFADPALFPEGVTTRCGDIAPELDSLAGADDTYIVIVTRGHQHDAEALKACIHKPAAYVGMIGSRRKVALIRESFIQAGIATEEEFDAVCTPIGLDIGAETVPEIATSIAAQLIAVRRRGQKGPEPRDLRSR